MKKIALGLLLCAALPALGEQDPGAIRLRLPPRIDAVAGIESNIYFDNVALMLNPANYAFDVICAKGAQQVERWSWTPTADDAGDHALALEVRDAAHQLVARAQTTIHVAPADAGVDRETTMLMIGDSLTHASVYPRRVVALCAKPGNPEVTLVGSFWPHDPKGVIRHEGYGGWTAKRFITHYADTAREGNYKKRGSPFLYKDGDAVKLDFPRYCREFNDGKPPDFVTIFLGPNDIYGANESNITASIDVMLANYDKLIAMVRAYGDKTVVGVMLPVPPAATQDAFGANSFSGLTRWQYKRNQHRLVERMLERYGGRESERISLVPTTVNIDCLHNYPAHDVEPSAHATIKIRRLNNAVHPADPGYKQIGDTVYAWLKAQLSTAP